MNFDLFGDKINLIYNYVYNNDENNYDIERINLQKINPSDIEISGGKLSDNILKQIKNNSFQFLFLINNDIYLKIITDNISSIIKISISKKSFNDNLISYILSELVLTHKTNHILLPIMNITIKLSDIKDILNNFNLPEKIENILEKEKNISLKIREGFFNLTTLRKYINENTINYKSLLFKIIHTLVIIRQKYKYFSHNNLILDNIFVYINKNINVSTYDEYKINNKIFYLPEEIYDIKITNFEDTILLNTKLNLLDEINDEKLEDMESDIKSYDNSSTTENIIKTDDSIIKTDDSIEIIEYPNNIYDLVILSTDILKENINIDSISKIFLTKLKDMKDNNNIENLLNDEYFNEFNEKKQLKVKIYNGTRIINTNIKCKLNSNCENVLGQQKNININNKNINKDNRHIIRVYEKNNKIKQKGGSNTVLPYKMEKNNPFKTNDERKTFTKSLEDKPPVKTPPVLLEQTIYDTTTQKPQRQEPPPTYIPLYNAEGNAMALPYANIINPEYKQPIQKVYNISLANPLHDFSTVSRIYEDIIPGDPRSFSFTTIYERTQLINFMRNLINVNIDGEAMNVTGGKNSLLSSIKLLDLNPYTLSKNPFMELGKNFLIYGAAYPIRYDEQKHSVSISRSAHGVNVRLYNIMLGELIGNTINKDIDNFNFDLWRELKYYKYIKENIVDKKISPNFICPILNKRDKLSNVNWNKLSKLQNKQNNQNNQNNQIANYNDLTIKANLFSNQPLTKLINPIVNLNNKDIKLYYLTNTITVDIEYTNLVNKLSPYINIKIILLDANDTTNTSIISRFNIQKYPSVIFKVDDKHIPYTNDMIADDIIRFITNNIITLNSLIDITVDSGETLVLLTEAPNSNIIKWASPLYESKGSLNKMLATGFHKANVWESVLFQIMYIMYILQKETIYFEEFSLENNIYIKDLYYEPNTLNYWIYNIDGLDYYVPNYGYLVLFDSKYNDTISKNYKILSPKLFPNMNDKIDNKNDPINYDNDIKNLIFNQFKETFDSNIFTSQLKLLGGLSPEAEILTLLNNIHNDTSLGTDINKYIRNYFNNYFNNRIGTTLLRTEKEIVNILNRPQFNKAGSLLVKQERYDEFKWVLFESQVPKTNLINIITKDNTNTIINETVNPFRLFNYPLPIGPNNIVENNIIELFK